MKRLFLALLLICISSFPAFPLEESDYFTSLENNVERFSFVNRAKSFDFIEEMYQIAHSSRDSVKLLSRTLYSEALLSERQGIRNPQLLINVNRLLADGIASPRDEIVLKSALRHIRLSEGNYAEVFTVSLDILDKAIQMKDSLWVARTYNALGIIAGYVDLFNLAEEYYLEGLEWVDPGLDDIVEFSIKTNLNYLYLSNSDEESKPEILGRIESFISELEINNWDGMLMINYLNTGNYWSDSGDNGKAFDYLMKAQELCIDNPYYESFILNNIGFGHLQLSNYKVAMEYFRKAQATLEKYPNLNFVSVVYENIATIHKLTGQPDSALLYIEKRDEAALVNNDHKLVMDVLRKYMVTSLDVSENKLALAQKDIKLKNKQFIITLLLAISFVLIALFVLIIYIQKRKSLRQQVKLKEAETKELSIQLEREQEQLENKLRELTSYSLLLSNKNNVLHEINNVAKRLPAEENEIKKKIDKIVSQNIEAENNWNDFMLHFDKVHPRFFERIQAQTAGITQNELKLTAYIRMGLSIKQIAQMSNVAPQSVKMSRHRLRQKLQLDTEQNLDSYIQNI